MNFDKNRLAVLGSRSGDHRADGLRDASLLADDLAHVLFSYAQLKNDGFRAFRFAGLKIMGSKYLYTFVNGILLGGVCGALGALDLSLIMMHEDDWQSFLRMMDIFLRVNQGVQTGQIVLAVAFYLVLMLLSLLTFFAMAYFAITLSHTLFRDKKWRTWVALLIFVGVYWGLSYLQGLLPNPVENLVFNTMYDPNAEITVTTFADMIPQMVPYALYDLAIVLLSLFGCGWMLDKKVSL